MTEIEELRDALERARTWAISLENELFGLGEMIRAEHNYCESVVERMSYIGDTESAEMWQHAANRIDCIRRAYEETFRS